MKPGWIPYKWYWILGGTLVALALLFGLQGNIGMLALMGLVGVMTIILGFVERHRGAPPV